jgi:hypothetical protein
LLPSPLVCWPLVVGDGGTFLSIGPIRSLESIAADPQFVPEEITSEGFETVLADRDLPAALRP